SESSTPMPLNPLEIQKSHTKSATHLHTFEVFLAEQILSDSAYRVMRLAAAARAAQRAQEARQAI
ncbi:MAG: hypothetical protein JJT93_16000, partial [Gammaproteobacteria bacterium]|nr:hypothetical protein [Gammaproteobacteria bacterium]